MRTESTVDAVLGKRDKNCLASMCGLPVTTYFSALKLKWLMDTVQEVKDAIEKGTCLFGTIDTWLIWVSIIILI